MERVQKFLSNSGCCSRREAEKLIEEGRVRINNKIAVLGDKISEKDKVYVDDELIKNTVKKYYVFYKPKNVLTTLYDPSNKKTIVEYIYKIPLRVYPVGRLDYDAEGLLLLTNDGDFANKIMHPRYEIDKTYIAELDKFLEKKDYEKLKKGIIKLKDGIVKVKEVKVLENKKYDKKTIRSIVKIKLHEGRNKIVKRIFKSLGYYVKNLKRIKIDSIILKNLKPGQYKELDKKYVKKILELKENKRKKNKNKKIKTEKNKKRQKGKMNNSKK